MTCHRRVWRLRPGHKEEAFVHLDLAGGSHVTLSLVEISAGGVAFDLGDGRPALAVGDYVESVVVQIGGFRVTGSARVTHVTPEFAVGTICGAEFTASTESDERLIALLLTALEKRTPRMR